MTFVYFDTSVLVSAYVEEAFSSAAESAFSALAPDELASSVWCETEAASALAAKVRAGVLDAVDAAALFRAISNAIRRGMTMIDVGQDQFRAAADLLLRANKPLRAGDALHLAIAASAGAQLVTLDKPMAVAGQALALDVRLLA